MITINLSLDPFWLEDAEAEPPELTARLAGKTSCPLVCIIETPCTEPGCARAGLAVDRDQPLAWQNCKLIAALAETGALSVRRNDLIPVPGRLAAGAPRPVIETTPRTRCVL